MFLFDDLWLVVVLAVMGSAFAFVAKFGVGYIFLRRLVLGSQPFSEPMSKPPPSELAVYAGRGLIGGLIIIGLGTILVLAGFGAGESELAIAGLQLKKVGPGMLLCGVGAYVIRLTRPRRLLETISRESDSQ